VHRLLLLLLLLPACPGHRTERAEPSPRAPAVATLADARAFAESQPSYLRPVPQQAVPAGLPDLRAATCGACHQAIYQEWRISTHARAWLDDPQFQAELAKSSTDDFDVGWMCRNCHTPLENQLPQLVAGLRDGHEESPIYVDNPGFDAALQLDAITCAACHVRDGVVLGPWGDTDAPHPVARSAELLGPELCTRCHQAAAEFPRIDLACTFTTGAEFAAGPYPAEGYTCQTCHMPTVERPTTALGTPVRQTRRHWFGGSRIPKRVDFAGDWEGLGEHYPDGLAVRWSPPASLAPGPARVVVTYANANAGHLLPSGDPERFLTVTLTASQDGGELARASARIGAIYQWFPDVKKLSDNRLGPREERTLALEFEARPEGPVTLSLRAEKWRISQENLDYHDLAGVVPPMRVTFDETVQVPIAR
jgi:hypothetical protein